MERPIICNELELINELKFNTIYKGKEYELSINKVKSNYLFILKNEEDFPPELYEEEYNLEKFKKNNLLFSLYNKIEDVFLFLKNNIEENKYNIEIDKEKVIFNVKSGVIGINDIKINIKKKEIDQNITIQLLCEEVKKLKEKIANIEQNKLNNNNNINDNNKISLEIKKKYENYQEIIYGINIFPNDNFIAYNGKGKLFIFGGKKLKNVYKIQGKHKNAISYIEIIDNNNFITCSFDKKIIIWNINGIKPTIRETLEGHSGKIFKVIYINPKIYSCGENGEIFIWEKKDKNFSCSKKLKGLEGKGIIYNLLQLNKNQLISSDNFGNLICWDLQNLNQEFKMNVAKSKWNNAIAKINDMTILYGGKDFIQLINLKDKKIEKSIKVKSIIYSIDLLNDDYFICGNNLGKLEIRKVDTLDKVFVKKFSNKNLIDKNDKDKKNNNVNQEIFFGVKKFNNNNMLLVCSSFKKIYLLNYKNKIAQK